MKGCVIMNQKQLQEIQGMFGRKEFKSIDIEVKDLRDNSLFILSVIPEDKQITYKIFDGDEESYWNTWLSPEDVEHWFRYNSLI